MDASPVTLIHLIELIDTADSHVRQNQSPSFQANFIGKRVSHHSGCKSDTGGTLAGGVDSSGG
jgi:hypothetical protein